jgi:transposase-like protein
MKVDGTSQATRKQLSSRYLNNLIEQHHHGVKQRIAVMLGFKQFRHAAITIALGTSPNLVQKEIRRPVVRHFAYVRFGIGVPRAMTAKGAELNRRNGR